MYENLYTIYLTNLPRILFSQQWSNVTLWDYANWVTKNSVETVVISGAKFTNNSVVLTNATYAKLPIPKYVFLSLL